MQRNQISANFFTKGTLMDIRESNKSKEAERLTNARDRRRAQMLRIMEHNRRTSHGSPPEADCFPNGLRSLKGSRPHAASSPIRVGRRASSPKKASRDRPDAPVAFGSRRPQRPSRATRMATGDAITLGRTGSVRGIF